MGKKEKPEVNFMSFTVNNLLSYIFPFAESEIYFDLKPSLVCRILSHKFHTGEIVFREGSWGWSDKRFTGSVNNEVFRLIGPFGNKEWVLVTQGTIRNHEGGTVIHLSFRLITIQLLGVLAMLVFYFFYGLYVLGFWPFWQILAAQVLFLYTVMMFVFHYQISRIKNWLKSWVNEGLDLPGNRPR